jgi:hypothetical protein
MWLAGILLGSGDKRPTNPIGGAEKIKEKAHEFKGQSFKNVICFGIQSYLYTCSQTIMISELVLH